jgi:predicted aldo/keto reductase-like oxidoreductase
MSDRKLTRRDFLGAGATGAAALMLGQGKSQAPADAPSMPTRPLGLTGHDVKLFSLGGQATLERPEKHDEAIAIINHAIDLGVNYIDTAASYGNAFGGYPVSQTHIGEVMASRRDEVFLATKTHKRTRDDSLVLLEESLRLLQTDHLDLWQIHNVKDLYQLDQVFAPGGAIEALEEAKDDGTVSFLGITGHFDPHVLVRGINRYPFDTVLMALNPADPHNLPFAQTVLPLAKQKQMGVIGMKIPGRGRLFRPDGVNSMSDAMGYVLSLPGVSTVIIGCDDVAQVTDNVSIATSFAPFADHEMERLENLTASYHEDAAWFKRKEIGFFKGEDDQQMNG